ncbi:MAG: hypothetical protein K6G15_03335 [Desulfovibrio sp.]|nr:hypothetical protein [Desulfovibrio sp.]
MPYNLHVNKHAPFEDPERTLVEQKAIEQVENHPEQLFQKYKSLPASYGGRYINSDLFKEVFPDYSASPANRTLFNVPVHNSAAVLANALFREMVASGDDSHGNRVLFITGIPGAGKTTAIQSLNFDFNKYKVVYEGQLSTFDQAKDKIHFCLKHNCSVDVVVFHRLPECALVHTVLRFYEIGRGASVTAMSNIQGDMADSFEKMFKEFNDSVRFRVIDLDDNSKVYSTKQHILQILRKEGDKHVIRQRLEQELGRLLNAGYLTESAYNESAGRSPKGLSGIADDSRCSERCRQAFKRESRSSVRERPETVVAKEPTYQNLDKYTKELFKIKRLKEEQFKRISKSLEQKIFELEKEINFYKNKKLGLIDRIFFKQKVFKYDKSLNDAIQRQAELRRRIRKVLDCNSDDNYTKMAIAKIKQTHPGLYETAIDERRKKINIEKEVSKLKRKFENNEGIKKHRSRGR